MDSNDSKPTPGLQNLTDNFSKLQVLSEMKKDRDQKLQEMIEFENNPKLKVIDVIRFSCFIGFAVGYDYMFGMSSSQLLGLSIIPTIIGVLNGFKYGRYGFTILNAQSTTISTHLQRVAKLSIYLPFLLYWFRNHTWGFGLILLAACV